MQLASLAAAALIGLNLVALPYFLFLLASALAACVGRSRGSTLGEPRTRFLVVIPAHNEEDGLAATVRSCRAFDFPADRFQVLVIADNCSDRTAEVGRAEGASVLERFDETKKSKGHAIEYLIEGLKERGELSQFDALTIIDADTTASANLLRCLDARLSAGADWAQCYYTVANPDDSWRTRLLTYAFTLFNGVIPLGQWVLGQSAGFKGNGMCFSTRGLERVPWRCRGLVEDMEYSWEVRLAGGKIAFVPEARVYGVMLARGGPAAAAQRRRWEFGRKALKARVLPAIWKSTHMGWPEKLISFLELTMPTTVALIGIAAFLTSLSMWVALGASLPTAASWFLIGSSLVLGLTMALYAFSPFFAFRLPWSYLAAWLYVPFYAGWKLLVALGGRPTQWVRTAREHASSR